LSTWPEAPGRGGLPLDLRAERPRPPRRGGAGGAHAARLHAEVRRVPRRGSGLPDPRAAALGGRARRRPRGSGHARGRQGRPGGRPRGGRRGTARLSDAVPEARVLLADAPGGDAARLGVTTRDLLRVTTAIGHFVDRAWVTEAIRPGVIACSHHLGRWRLHPDAGGERWSSALVELQQVERGKWRMRQLEGVRPF